MTITEVKERPILFSGPMVLAIRTGKKSQTRRVINPQPPDFVDWMEPWQDGWRCYMKPGEPCDLRPIKCPYGAVGQRLWVRETIEVLSFGANAAQIRYLADGQTRIVGDRKLPDRPKVVRGLFMPRQCCRVIAEITSIRTERLHEITESDAKAEGCSLYHPIQNPEASGSYRFDFQCVWDQLNDERGYSWSTNPWVWIVEFQCVEDQT